ncbi:MAG: anti-sigma F factor [Oscillospiraceae bacterium]|jgi:stage II sporulation protein AB (anti-sigma F factor)
MKQTDYIKFEFPSRSVNEGFARAAAASFAARLDPTLEELADIKTAVSEAVTNCIVHAYPSGVGTIWMRVGIREGNVLEIQIKDKGVGIPDVDKAREPLFTTGGDDRSGMGFTIMESFMDRVRVKSKEGKGTTVTLTRKIKRKAPIL